METTINCRGVRDMIEYEDSNFFIFDNTFLVLVGIIIVLIVAAFFFIKSRKKNRKVKR